MKVSLVVGVVLSLIVCVVANANEEYLKEFDSIPAHEFGDEYTSLIELGTKLAAQAETQAQAGEGGAALATYLPDSGPYDNPATDTNPVQTIPSTPSCTVRGQTIFEIRKMRSDAKQIGMSIMYEIQTMEKRKAYIEQMTAYLNDRIRELNKVKRDLAAEQKWIQVSNQRIAELAQKEKLIKLQDVMACIKSEQERLNGEKGTKVAIIKAMAKQEGELQNTIKAIRDSMSKITTAAGANAAGDPAGGGGAPAEFF